MCTPRRASVEASERTRKIFPLRPGEEKQKATYNAYFATPFLRNLTEITDLVCGRRGWATDARGLYSPSVLTPHLKHTHISSYMCAPLTISIVHTRCPSAHKLGWLVCQLKNSCRPMVRSLENYDTFLPYRFRNRIWDLNTHFLSTPKM